MKRLLFKVLFILLLVSIFFSFQYVYGLESIYQGFDVVRKYSNT